MARALAWHARGHRFDPDILHSFWKTMNGELLTFSLQNTIFDILTHETVSKDFVKLIDETAESMSFIIRKYI